MVPPTALISELRSGTEARNLKLNSDYCSSGGDGRPLPSQPCAARPRRSGRAKTSGTQQSWSWLGPGS